MLNSITSWVADNCYISHILFPFLTQYYLTSSTVHLENFDEADVSDVFGEPGKHLHEVRGEGRVTLLVVNHRLHGDLVQVVQGRDLLTLFHDLIVQRTLQRQDLIIVYAWLPVRFH